MRTGIFWWWTGAAVVCVLVTAAALAADSPLDVGSVETVLELAAQEKYAEAVALFKRVRAELPDTIEAIHGHKVAVVYAHMGDRAGHAAHCRWLMERYEDSDLPTDAERSVKGYLIFPSADDPALIEHALERSRVAVANSEARNEYQWIHWFWGSLGIAEYRAGNFAEAAEQLEKAAASDNLYIRSLALPFHAMTEFERGNLERARELLLEAREEAARLPKPGTDEYLEEWTDTLTTQIAMAEAERICAAVF